MGGKILCVVGTRPEAIKLAPVILRLRQVDSAFTPCVLTTGQQTDLVNGALSWFGIEPEVRIDPESSGHRLDQTAARLMVGIANAIEAIRPDFVIGQGDTTSVLAASLASFYQRVPFAHVEAGLRTGIRDSPFPEEMHRVVVGRLAMLHFAPTERASSHLRAEGVDAATIHVTGNTVIDALSWTFDRRPVNPLPTQSQDYLLVTFHRRENWLRGLDALCEALRVVLQRLPEAEVVLPVHPNPNVRQPILDQLHGERRIHLIDPVDYPGFVALMRDARLILTDSGGIQEEAPALGKTVLVARAQTERPEGFATGLVHCVALDRDAIAESVVKFWTNEPAPPIATLRPTPYGDGQASARIVRALTSWFDSGAVESQGAAT